MKIELRCDGRSIELDCAKFVDVLGYAESYMYEISAPDETWETFFEISDFIPKGLADEN